MNQGILCIGDVETAYAEVLCFVDNHGLIELMNRTGPVLERLSLETADEILCTLIPHLVDQKFMVSLIPWLQQASFSFSVEAILE